MTRLGVRGAAFVACAVLGVTLAAQERFIDVNRGVKEVGSHGPVHTVHVSGDVYALIGGGANIVVSAGEEGVLVVDTGAAAQWDNIIASIRDLAKGGQIRWIVNTTLDPDHVGNNEKMSNAGRTVNGNPAAIISHEKLPIRMIKLPVPVPVTARPVNTFFSESRDLFFNDDPVFIYHTLSHTDGDVFVFFRGSDVVSAGDVFRTDGYPRIDLTRGGSIQGELDALNRLVNLAIPSVPIITRDEGTLVIPAHGHVCDQFDVVGYRDMVTIVRDRVRELKASGKTLDQIKAAAPAKGYAARYGSGTGPGSTNGFIEAIYRSLVQVKS